MHRNEIIDRRRRFRIEGYTTLGEVNFDGNWVTPLQIISDNSSGPVLVALNWFDRPSFLKNERTLRKLGYLPSINFNIVLDQALEYAGLSRGDVYMTQVFHLLPETRSQAVPTEHMRKSFDQVTRHELRGRAVVALGSAAAKFCREFRIDHVASIHPSARGLSFQRRSELISESLSSVL
ncbi:MAG: hypothetical protein GC208_05365 [Alphaproteobacteria bacterium]|nr:hypothetical protein [Alphaproteobacteria bacterium]